MENGMKGFDYKLVRHEHRHKNVCGIVGDEEEGSLSQQCLILANVHIDLGLALKVRHRVFTAGDLLVIGKCAPNVVFKCGSLRSRLCAVNTLCGLNGNSFLNALGSERGKEVGDNEYGVRTLLRLVSGRVKLFATVEPLENLTSNALTRLSKSLVSAVTISTPWAVRALAEVLSTLRVTPRTLYVPDFKAEATTEPPWAPVAPTTVRILDMLKK
jgi:hypothetical protein